MHGSILLVDDDHELNQMLTEYLSSEGFTIEAALDGAVALESLSTKAFDLVVLDVMLPTLSGFDVLRRVRASRAVPVIMLTARGDDIDRILGFELGADDYLSKPFNPRELAARIRAVLRRSATGPERSARSTSLGPLSINAARFEVRVSGRRVRLTGTEFRVLEALVHSAGQVQSRELLTERILGRKLSAYDRSIDTHISNLRRKCSFDENSVVELRNIRGLGYVLIYNKKGDQ